MARSDIIKVSGTTPEQRTRWRAAAGGGERDLSAWLRSVADAAAGEAPGGRAVEDLRAELVQLRADLARGAGNLLNQVAHRLHADALAGRPADPGAHVAVLESAQADVAKMRGALTEALAALRPPRRR